MQIKVQKTENLKTCLDIRRKVFIEGQNVPEDREIDGHDDNCHHYLAHIDSTPVATCRLRPVNNTGKIERVGVLDGYRGAGIGRKLMQFVIENAKTLPEIDILQLGAQIQAVNFYKNLGFTVDGEPFIDAGIEHLNMVIRIK